MQTEIRCSAGISVELLDWVVLVSASCSSSPSKGTTSTLGRVECRFDHTALAARPLHSAFGRTLAHTARSWIDLERQQRVDLTGSPSRRRMAGVCAKLTAGVDVNQTLGIAAVDVAAGGKTPVHLGAMASPRRRTARFAHASNALHPTLV
jgi:hypothetical protein